MSPPIFADLSEPTVYTTSETKLSVYHLEVGTTYYWQVADGQNTSQTYTFTTEGGYARFVEVEGVSNFRDVGGYSTTDGKRVKQGMMRPSRSLPRPKLPAELPLRRGSRPHGYHRFPDPWSSGGRRGYPISQPRQSKTPQPTCRQRRGLGRFLVLVVLCWLQRGSLLYSFPYGNL